MSDDCRISDILTRRAEVHEPGTAGIDRLHARRERSHERNRDGSRAARFPRDCGRVDAFNAGRGGNRAGSALGNDARLRLRPRERGFEVEHRLQERPVGEDLGQRVGRRETVDQV